MTQIITDFNHCFYQCFSVSSVLSTFYW